MTLIELMIVVTIISITALAFAPSITDAMADRRCATATMELVRMGRRARAESIGLQRAMLVHIAYGRPPQTARLRVLRGNVTRCDAEDWRAREAECPANQELERSSTACLESLDLSNSRWFHAPYAITVGMFPAGDAGGDPAGLIGAGGSGSMAFCYEPNGMTRWSTVALGPGAGMGFSTLNAGAAGGGGALFAVGLYNRDTNQVSNTPRIVLYPLAGTPRRLR